MAYAFWRVYCGASAVKSVKTVVQTRHFSTCRLKPPLNFGLEFGGCRVVVPVSCIRYGHRCLSADHKAKEISKKWTMLKKLGVGLGGIVGAILLLKLVGTDDTDNEEIYVDAKSKDKNGLMRYKGVWLPRVMFGSKLWPEIQKFIIHPDDIFVVSYPKSGTTWVQEIVYLLLNIDTMDKAGKESLGTVFPYLEFPYPGLKAVVDKPRPRTIKTHLPYKVLPSDVEKVKPKIIYVARNVKDVSVSYYHFHRSMAQVSYAGSFEDFLENFLLGKVSYDSWWNHVRSFWNRRNDDNIHFVKYEDLKQVPIVLMLLFLLVFVVYSRNSIIQTWWENKILFV